jgi:O-antigen/teichoic acid export membrane protein
VTDEQRVGGLSRNVVVVGVGLAIIGLGSLGLLAIVARSLQSQGFAQFGIWFGFVNVLAFGLFVPLETATTKALLSATGPVARLARQIAVYSLVAVMGTVLVVLVFRSIVVPRLMGGSANLAIITIAYLSVMATQAIQRGVAVGRNRFWPLFWQFATDGVLRLVLPGIVVATGSASPSTFALALVVSATSALLVGQVALARPHPGSPSAIPGRTPDQEPRLDIPGLAALIVAAIGAQLLANGVAPILGLFSRDSSAVLAGVVGVMALTRMPLLFASAIQSPLLPPMVRAVRIGDVETLWLMLRRASIVFTTLYIAAWIAGWYVGRAILRSYLGDDYGVPHLSLALLTSAGVALLAIVAFQAAVVAASANTILVLSWVAGSTVFLSIMAIPESGFVIAPAAVTFGAATTLLIMVIGLRWKTGSKEGADQRA